MTKTKTSLENAFDRGGYDSYYRRGENPHVMLNGVEVSVLADSAEGLAYLAGYKDNERIGNFKDCGERDRDDPRMLDMGDGWGFND